jgi:hypothetical protein
MDFNMLYPLEAGRFPFEHWKRIWARTERLNAKEQNFVMSTIDARRILSLFTLRMATIIDVLHILSRIQQ